MKTRTVLLVSAVAVLVIIAVAVVGNLPNQPSHSSNPPSPPQPPPPAAQSCKGSALCLSREVVRVIDGDTLDIVGGMRIRLVLVNAPELSETGGPEAKAFLESLCFGVRALIDEDDFQVGDDPYGRVLAIVYCDGTNANAAMIHSGYASLYTRFCSVSEFQYEPWTGCP